MHFEHRDSSNRMLSLPTARHAARVGGTSVPTQEVSRITIFFLVSDDAPRIAVNGGGSLTEAAAGVRSVFDRCDGD
ncbi:hypothetical protein [Xanthomonas rydalmerensis]|uniref:Uncharacterized protein n=1 Tax=Xanthomonas rydalmerensis TaxID=3046274 RepID=A0ABZ0JM07_9XANT|nr:hypothetical protein [Xanthomonas sp. DM-2023]WOS40849.1 hypothetical protein QN243_21095 [Xanthomonas sp. DM-2023]WOS45034.1 hypothetical protein QN242_21095 [Xanthomonas sp. DM-2023]WOS49213.1 hypothetical protein QN240_21095 [Xanthomonas sp. DM-2023]WOS53393.1 hypothetical protein QN244_21100 [Xanthomonas sp. DM-2023]WOS57576.1 hypothetical protein QN245_21095 [Xanthomonas sp. DM-2023]